MRIVFLFILHIATTQSTTTIGKRDHPTLGIITIRAVQKMKNIIFENRRRLEFFLWKTTSFINVRRPYKKVLAPLWVT